ncbi:hypothetical protein WICPIJ_008639 [Wickerhamomyces pijperi]|uniref:Uncharacterized protein n=1 Tax=Wickerhamomyces pijperi TaxID=599730 RepID=A0A9P8PVY7_WICPI|nr:hypothetical protein WICPIJ_008639 [Wickerhamomyces pijperi]
MEQSTVTDRILIIIPRVPLENLPSQTTTTVIRVPSISHGIENRFHDSDPPESLIIVTFCSRLIQWNIIPVITNLRQQTLNSDVDKGVILHIEPVINHRTPGTTGFPPLLDRDEVMRYPLMLG